MRPFQLQYHDGNQWRDAGFPRELFRHCVMVGRVHRDRWPEQDLRVVLIEETNDLTHENILVVWPALGGFDIIMDIH